MEARFVSRGPNFSMGVRDAEVEDYATGKQKTIVANLEAQFDPRGVTDEDLDTIETARREGRMPDLYKGLPLDRETEGHVSIRSRLGVWDSKVAKTSGIRGVRLSAADADLVIQALRGSPQNGMDYVEVVKAQIPAPWPAYDQMDGRHPEKIVETAISIGADIPRVIAYERDNKARKAVLEALNEVLDDTVDAEQSIVINA